MTTPGGRRLRVAIVGCGKVARTHAAALRELDGADLVAACDRTQEGAEAFARELGIAPYTDLAAMLDDQGVDAVTVCTPHPRHADAVEVAAAHGIHSLVEKPLAATLADCDRAIDACAAAGVHLGIVSQRRLYPPVVRMKRAIDEGRIGRPVLATVELLGWREPAYYRSNPWRGTWAGEGGGVLVNQAPHHLDLLQWLLGPAEEVFGYWTNANHPEIEVEDTAIGAIRFRDGALATVVLSNAQNPGVHGRIHIHGSNGASIGARTEAGSMFIAGVTTAVDPPVTDLWTIPGEEDRPAAWEAEDARDGAGDDVMTRYHRLLIADFLEAIRDGRPPMVDGSEGRKVVELISAIYRSQRDHAPVRLPLAREADRDDMDGRLPSRAASPR